MKKNSKTHNEYAVIRKEFILGMVNEILAWRKFYDSPYDITYWPVNHKLADKCLQARLKNDVLGFLPKGNTVEFVEKRKKVLRKKVLRKKVRK